jgi:farnesyl-diphosphate farnesyltransferase
MAAEADVLAALETTSRTFYIPIVRLPARLKEAVSSAYLCLRAIDEIEDHPSLDPADKADLLGSVSRTLQGQTRISSFSHEALETVFARHRSILPEVTLRLADWACHAPQSIAPRIWDATAAMADRMAFWARRRWAIESRDDLDAYTFGVAGAVGILLCDLWAWFDSEDMDRQQAIEFGRGLQLVNILRNRAEDLTRGADFYPRGWGDPEMRAYAYENLRRVQVFAHDMPAGPFAFFIRIPLTLAIATLEALERGEGKLSRAAVIRLLQLDS